MYDLLVTAIVRTRTQPQSNLMSAQKGVVHCPILYLGVSGNETCLSTKHMLSGKIVIAQWNSL